MQCPASLRFQFKVKYVDTRLLRVRPYGRYDPTARGLHSQPNASFWPSRTWPSRPSRLFCFLSIRFFSFLLQHFLSISKQKSLARNLKRVKKTEVISNPNLKWFQQNNTWKIGKLLIHFYIMLQILILQSFVNCRFQATALISFSKWFTDFLPSAFSVIASLFWKSGKS